MKKIVVGLLAHVDAGKTTLSESILYQTGQLSQIGRVDHQDSFLDYYKQERDRGITIFSKVSPVNYKDTYITFIDTPGHVDFSGEMERAISILDYAVMIISANDGVQSHTKTIWSLLKRYHVPTMIFVNKMDMSHYDKNDILSSLHELSSSIVEYDDYESIALLDEYILEDYLNTQKISDTSYSQLLYKRQLFPVVFGSALKNEHVDSLLNVLDCYTLSKKDNHDFKAIVYKILNDDVRLTFMKIVSGSIHVKDDINGEKIHSIRRYYGQRYDNIDYAEMGDVVAVTGLTIDTGEVIGDTIKITPQLSPAMIYKIIVPDDCDKSVVFPKLLQLNDEEPLLNIEIYGNNISVCLMGDVQIDILKDMIFERMGIHVDIVDGDVLYKESIENTVEGVGHFEPLRHYAEVHLLLEPLDRGSGLVFKNRCMNHLEMHYQNLIMSHLEEMIHTGVLTRSPITDMCISLLGAKAHQKHTEGGDFREATYRAIQNGLMKADNILLEPYYDYEIHIPNNYTSKVFYDLQDYPTPTMTTVNDTAILTGKAPVKFLSTYQSDLLSYSHGEAQIAFSKITYEKVLQHDFIPHDDVDHPAGSIFCKHGAGFYVNWFEVENYMHLPLFTKQKSSTSTYKPVRISEEELQRVFTRTLGEDKTKLHKERKRQDDLQTVNTVSSLPLLMIIDGYNVIFSSEELKDIASTNIGNARDHLIDMLSSYQGFRKCEMIVVFDAYRVPQNRGQIYSTGNLQIVYTKENQLADHYIETITKDLTKTYQVIVVTSDALEQTIISGHGALRMSSRELLKDIELKNSEYL